MTIRPIEKYGWGLKEDDRTSETYINYKDDTLIAFHVGGAVFICPEDGKDAFLSFDELQSVYETAKQMKDYKRQ